ncbi:MAG TPA: HTTM domain-containing protein, partial [Polyangiaceae bacterium]|nr:HTTM domain-containing protein [Polyangiaceae bacterium]
ALCFTLGYRTRWAGVTAGVSGYFLFFQEPFGFNATLHLMFQGVILLAATDAGAALALRPVPARNVDSSKLLIRTFLASIYAWASVVKLRRDWFDGRTLALFHENGSLSGPFADFLLGTEARRALVACAVVATELTMPLLLFAPRTRRLAPYMALSLHLGIELSARPDLLGWSMAALLLSILPRPSAS